MRCTPLPNCCAVNLLSGFGNTNIAEDTTPYTKDEVKDYILKCRTSYSVYSNKHIQLIALNEEQLDKLTRELFIELGFTISEPMYYAGHGNNIYLLTYNPNKTNE